MLSHDGNPPFWRVSVGSAGSTSDGKLGTERVNYVVPWWEAAESLDGEVLAAETIGEDDERPEHLPKSRKTNQDVRRIYVADECEPYRKVVTADIE